MPRPYISRWESATQGPTPANLIALADALEVAPHRLTDHQPDQATLRDLRIWAGLNTYELADRLGVLQADVVRYETGRTVLPDRLVDRLAEAAGINAGTVRDARARTQQP